VNQDWVRWHEAYDDPASYLSARLAYVQAQLSDALTAAPPGPVRLLSLCAGQGNDVLGVLPGHPRRDDVTAVLVEYESHNAAVAADRARRAGLTDVEVRQADAGVAANYADMLPADVLLLCGIFGNVSDADVRRTVLAASAMCVPGATVIWTRHRIPPDLTPQLLTWFTEAGFAEVAFAELPAAPLAGVGVARWPAATPPNAPGSANTPSSLPEGRLFTFRGAD
jgi:Putative methyltransferase